MTTTATSHQSGAGTRPQTAGKPLPAVSLAIGLDVLSRRRAQPVAGTPIVIYVAIGVVIATVNTVLSGA